MLLAGGGDRLVFVKFGFPGNGGDDLFAVEAAVFDEDAGCLQAADHYSCDVNSGDIRFESVGVNLRALGGGVQMEAGFFEEVEIRMVAGERENLRGGQSLLFAVLVGNDDLAGLDADWACIEERANFTGGDAIVHVGANPILE